MDDVADRSTDPIERAHLTGASAPTPPIHRYPAPDALQPVARRHWVPVWRLPPGVTWTQKVLQYPVCLVVVSDSYARLYGVRTGLSTVDLSGDGWAVGTMLQPAAGALLWGASVAQLTDRFVDVGEVPGLAGVGLARRVRTAMGPDPADPARHAAAVAVTEEALARLLPVDPAGELVNTIVDRVEHDPSITRVAQLADAVSSSERQLQRLTRDRLGLSPKWLIQRRRLHEATLRLKRGTTSLGRLAVELGYADQAHFTRDFARVTGMAPGGYRADQ